MAVDCIPKKLYLHFVNKIPATGTPIEMPERPEANG
jgi:hypothetical protein